MNTTIDYTDLKSAIAPMREELVRHPLYANIQTLGDLRVFMEHHIFAVWDFMSLLKSLQIQLTGVTLPWTPRGDGLSRRLINEIVLAEETDMVGDHYTSHFELYRDAMEQCGADTRPIDTFIGLIEGGMPVEDALHQAGAPNAAQAFVRATWETIESGSLPAIAASFTLGREDLIPDMFRALVCDLNHRWPGQLSVLVDYLERHILLDEVHHTPMALSMLGLVCQGDDRKLQEVVSSAQGALHARIALWDGIYAAFARSRGGSFLEAERVVRSPY